MPSDATAAGVYTNAVNKFNPLESFMAGVQTAHAAKRLALAESGALFDNVLKQQGMQMEREQLALKEKLAAEQTKIDWFNAQTNRLNATRPLRSSASSPAMGGTIPGFTTDEEGNLIIDLTGQAPTMGEGDGEEVAPLTPLANDGEPSLLPTGGSMQNTAPGMAPLPGMSTGSNAVPSATAPTAKSPKMYVTGGSMNAKTGSKTFNWSTTKPGEKDGESPIQPEMFESYKRLAATEGMEIGEMTADGTGIKSIKLSPKAGAGDISISSLPDDQQKHWAGLMTELVTMAENTRKAGTNPTDAQKMAAVGLTDPDQMTPELWQKGYALMTPTGAMDALTMKAREYAAQLNLTFQGKKGYVPRTAESVLIDLGVNPPVPPAAAAQAKEAASTGKQTTGMQQQPGNPADVAKYENDIIPKLQKQVQEAKNPQDRNYAQSQLTSAQDFLSKLKGTKALPGEPAPASAPAATGKQEGDVFQRIASKESSKAQQKDMRQEADRQLWETGKQEVLRALVDSGADMNEIRSSTMRSQERIFGSSKKHPATAWLDDNIGKLGIKTKDGGKLERYSVIFTDKDGRKVTLSDLFQAAIHDPRVEQALGTPKRAAKVQEGGQNLSPDAKAVLKEAGLSD